MAESAHRHDTGEVADLVDDLMALWQSLPEDEDAARAAFARVYAERVQVNGVEVTIDGLVGRARALQGALTGITHEVLERVEADDKVVVAFRLRGRHTGTFVSSVGDVPATGQDVWVQGMDVLTLTDGRITAITVVTDELGLLSRLGVVSLR